MVDAVAEEERSKYETMWNQDAYRERSPGLRFLNDALQKMNMPDGSSVVDLGCGTGRVSAALSQQGYDVTALDIAANACTEFNGPFVEACIWDLPDDLGQFEYGFCADVMEHIPTDKVSDTLKHISKHVDTCYFQIANFECHMGRGLGLHLHLTVKSVGWWKSALERHFSDVQIEAQAKHHIAVCRR